MADDPVCAFCSKPILHLAAAGIARGELVHLRCQARTPGLKGIETADRSPAALGPAQAAVAPAGDMTKVTPSLRLRKVIIVARGHAGTYAVLRQRHGRRVAITSDRRRAERRQGQQPLLAAERRSGRDRRSPLTLPEELLWREAGYRIVYRAAPPPSQVG